MAGYSEGLEQREQAIVTWEVLVSQDKTEDIPMAQRQYEIQKHMQEPVAYVTSANPDIMYLHEVMKAPGRDQFKRAMDKELQDHIARKHWERRSAKRDESTGYGVGYAMQEADRHT